MSLQDDTTLFAPAAAAEFTWVGAERAVVRGETAVTLVPRHGACACDARLRWSLAGTAGAPVVVALGGISASREVCAWWDAQAGAGRAIDLRRFRVLGIDWLATDDLAGADAVAASDQADAIAALLDALGIARAHALVGSSYGAMVGLEFAARHPQRLRRLVAISGAHRAHPLSTALRHVQREIVREGLANGAPERALSLARQLAMTTYRGAVEFAERFDVEPEVSGGRGRFAVAEYLESQGARFVARFDARRFLALSESIDLHRVDPRTIAVPVTLIGVASDRLVPIEDLRELARALPDATLEEIDSRYGHDAFLKEPEQIGALLRAALDS